MNGELWVRLVALVLGVLPLVWRGVCCLPSLCSHCGVGLSCGVVCVAHVCGVLSCVWRSAGAEAPHLAYPLVLLLWCLIVRVARLTIVVSCLSCGSRLWCLGVRVGGSWC
jgi:hypothetical protein